MRWSVFFKYRTCLEENTFFYFAVVHEVESRPDGQKKTKHYSFYCSRTRGRITAIRGGRGGVILSSSRPAPYVPEELISQAQSVLQVRGKYKLKSQRIGTKSRRVSFYIGMYCIGVSPTRGNYIFPIVWPLLNGTASREFLAPIVFTKLTHRGP